MSTENLSDRYHRDSDEGFEAVLDRVMQALGRPMCSYAEALDVSENTLKTWKRRGAISMKWLEGFARERNVSLDWLREGQAKTEPATGGLVLTPEERALLENFRACSQEGRTAIKTTSAALAKSAGVKKKAG